jgi:hypothetical protein
MLSQGSPGQAMPDYVIYLDVCNNMVLPGLDRSTFPVVGIVSNWDRTIDKLERCISIFDCMFVGDAKAIPLLESIGGRDVRVAPLTGFSLADYDNLPDTPGVRPHDITFIGDVDGENGDSAWSASPRWPIGAKSSSAQGSRERHIAGNSRRRRSSSVARNRPGPAVRRQASALRPWPPAPCF